MRGCLARGMTYHSAPRDTARRRPEATYAVMRNGCRTRRRRRDGSRHRWGSDQERTEGHRVARNRSPHSHASRTRGMRRNPPLTKLWEHPPFRMAIAKRERAFSSSFPCSLIREKNFHRAATSLRLASQNPSGDAVIGTLRLFRDGPDCQTGPLRDHLLLIPPISNKKL